MVGTSPIEDIMRTSDQKFLLDYHEWLHPGPGALDKVKKPVVEALDKVGYSNAKEIASEFGGKVSETQIANVVKKSVAGTVEIMNEIASASSPYSDIRQKQAARFDLPSFGPHNATEVNHCEIRKSIRLDRQIGMLGGLGEGAATGAAGGVGLLVDIPTLVFFTMRSSLVMAAKHGIEIEDDFEKAFALQAAFNAKRGREGAAKATFAREIHVIAMKTAKRKTWKELEEHGLVQLIRKLSEKLALRLTKAKLAAVIPVVGAIVSGGFNAHWMSTTHRDLQFVYGRRFLEAQYGVQAVERQLAKIQSEMV
jgi:hypothetical protein